MDLTLHTVCVAGACLLDLPPREVELVHLFAFCDLGPKMYLLYSGMKCQFDTIVKYDGFFRVRPNSE